MDFIEIQQKILDVYGKKPLVMVLVFVLLEIVGIIIISHRFSQYISVTKRIVVIFAFLLSFCLFLHAIPNADYHKVIRKGSVCSIEKELIDIKGEPDKRLPESLGVIYQQHYFEKYGKKADLCEEYDYSVICEDSLQHYAKQALLCFVVLVLGYLFTRAVLRCEDCVMNTLLASHMGVGMVVFLFMISMICQLHIKEVSVLMVVMILMSLLILWNKRLKINVTKKDIFAIGVLLLASVGASLFKWFKFAGDCIIQLENAVAFLNAGTLGESFTLASTFGFFGTALHGVAIVVGEDYFYSIYLILNVSSVGVAVYALKKLCDTTHKKNKVYFFIVVVSNFCVLLLNFDFENYCVWILSNAPIAGYLLIIVVCSFLMKKNNYEMSWIVAVASFTIMVTRVEGVCYVILFLLIPLERRGELKKSSIIVGSEIIIWQIVQFCFYNGSIGGTSWSPKRGLAFSTIAVFLIAFQFIESNRAKIVEYMKKYYIYFFLVALLLVIVYAFCANREFALETSRIFIAHLSVSRYSNSLAYWLYFIMITPLLIIDKPEEIEMGLAFVLGYYLLIFGISLFRVGLPFHVQISDSLRRMMFQGQMFFTFIVSYFMLCKNEPENNII